MSENKKDENSLIESQENVEQSDVQATFENRYRALQKEIDEVNDLLEKEKQKSFMALEKWKRAIADYQNLEKRTEQEIVDKVNAKTDKLIMDFLNIYENFVRAKNAYVKEDIDVEGLEVIIKNIESVLSGYEVKPIDAVGKIFDPNLHEAVSTINDQSLDDNTITKEIAKGYISQNRVIRASKVVVSKKNQINE
jgi:molecular chaperone GrpE